MKSNACAKGFLLNFFLIIMLIMSIVTMMTKIKITANTTHSAFAKSPFFVEYHEDYEYAVLVMIQCSEKW